MLLLAICNIFSLFASNFACYCPCLDRIAAIVSFPFLLLLLLLIYVMLLMMLQAARVGFVDNTI